MDSLAATGQPFHILVLTVSNHRPYTYPAGRVAADPGEHRRANAVRYADWALGDFMSKARGHAWFDRTLFVIMGDHGARVYGAAQIPLPSYQVPILFYAPGRIAAGRRVATLASSLDVPPTILARLGLPYVTRFFGRDVLQLRPEEGRALMTHNSDIALMRDEEVAVLGLRGSGAVYRVDRTDGQQFGEVVTDSTATVLLHDAIAYYHLADRLYRGGGYRFVATSDHGRTVDSAAHGRGAP
jgi:arylsulfatase A-like enzyme